MRTKLHTLTKAAVTAAIFGLSPLAMGVATAQEAPATTAQETPPATDERPPEGINQGSAPNWPAGLENWDTKERDPENPDPDEAERRGLTSPEVQESLAPNPTEQGTRPPDADVAGEAESDIGEQAEGGSPLYAALHWVRRAPPDLEGNPVPRPNEVASEPLADRDLVFPKQPAAQQTPTDAVQAEEDGPQEAAPAKQ